MTLWDLTKGNVSWCLSFQELPALYLKGEETATQDSLKTALAAAIFFLHKFGFAEQFIQYATFCL